ncbi:unnamed protein product [Parajaminaea phylloscopi]
MAHSLRTSSGQRRDESPAHLHPTKSATATPSDSGTPARRRSSSRNPEGRPVIASRLVTLWIHEPPNFSASDIVLSPELLAAFGPLGQNDLLGVKLPPGVEPRDPTDVAGADPLHHGHREAKARGKLRRANANRCFVFKPAQAVTEADPGATRSSQLQLSLSKTIASIYGFSSRQEVVLSKEPLADSLISHVELYFRDQYIGRADMWRLATLLEDTCVYVGQKIALAGCVRATIGRLFVNERKVTCGYVSPETKTVFRSESAKYHLLVQLGTEMWDFDEDGEVYFEKALTGFLPELLRRWRSVSTNHVLSITLFARVWYEPDEVHMLDEAALPVLREPGDAGRHYIDYYKVIVDLESQSDWNEVLSMLKEEVFRFQHDILLIGRPEAGPSGAPWQEEQHADLLRRDRALLAGRLSASHEGNILEAVNLALNPMDEHYIDRDLNRTGLDLIILTAGTGHFRVNKDWLRLTTERMIDNGIGLDLVCLTKMPLHSVPLFHFFGEVPQRTPEPKHSGPASGSSTATPGRQRNSANTPTPTPTPALRPAQASSIPDPLYFDAQRWGKTGSADVARGTGSTSGPLIGFYSIPHWIDASFYNLQQDQPFRVDRFVPRVKMREIQQIGYMENEISDISLPYLDLRRVPGFKGSAMASSFGLGRSGGDGPRSRDAARKSLGSQPKHASLGSDVYTSREQRRALRERFDRETFRDFEFAPINVRSSAILASGGAVGNIFPSSNSMSRDGGDASRFGTGSGSAESPLLRSTSSRPSRIGRDSLRGKPALESHAEDDDWADGVDSSPQVQHSAKEVSRSRERPLSLIETGGRPRELSGLPATTSMQSLFNGIGNGTGASSRPTSRPASIRSSLTFAHSLRPLQPAGKADAFVATAQAQDLLAEMPSPSRRQSQVVGDAVTAPSSPAHEAVSLLLGHSTPSKPQARRVASTSAAGSRYKQASSWLWNSFTAHSASPSRPNSPPPSEASHPSKQAIHSPLQSPERATSTASLRIKALLRGAASPTRGVKEPRHSAVNGRADRPELLQSRTAPHLKPDDSSANAAGNGYSEDDELAANSPGPITIPLPGVAPTHGTEPDPNQTAQLPAETNTEEARFQEEQEAYEQALEDDQARTRYAQRAQVEKQTLVNPSNPRKSLKANPASSQLLRWQHLFPRRLNRHVVKWRSITTPACLPLTTFYLPTRRELMEQWAEYPHTLSISSDLNSILVKRSPSTAPAMAALREMTSQRLAQGFQFIIPMPAQPDNGSGDASNVDGTASSRRFGSQRGAANDTFALKSPTELFQPGILASGNPILLGMSNQIHRLSYDRAAGAINVERYIRKISYDTTPIQYGCCIWPRHLPGYHTVRTTFRYPDLTTYDWTLLDSLVTGHAEEESFTESLRYWRTRILIVPTEGRAPPMIAPTGEQLDDEEIRLIGMDRLADMFARARWRGSNSKDRGGSGGQRGHAGRNSLLRFIPTSLDPSTSMFDEEFVRQMEAAIVEDEQVEEAAQQRRAASRSKRQIKDASLDSVAIAMAHDRHGVKIEDRYWNRRIYASVFTGTDLTTWLLEDHVDIRDREEAAEWGKTLMQQGLFEHATGHHGFLDGHYFYRLKGDYAKKAASVVSRRSARDDGSGNGSGRSFSGRDARRSASSGSGSGKKLTMTSKATAAQPRRMKMSRSLVIDVDPGRKSDRAETAFLHYDISHNPANGFNAQMHWLGTTSRFIEDTVQNWTRAMERYGLRLIEAPIGQICDVGKHNPFQAAVPIHLSLEPPAPSSYAHLLPAHINPRDYFEWALLRHFGFVLDQEAADRYPDDVEIIYESRPSRFDYSQFVHRSGIAFVQVVGGTRGFLWLTNRLFNSHINPGGNSGPSNGDRGPSGRQGRRGREGASRRSGPGGAGGGASNGAGDEGTTKTRGRETEVPDPDRARREFAAFCADPTALHDFYIEVLLSIGSGTGVRGSGSGSVSGTGGQPPTAAA